MLALLPHPSWAIVMGDVSPAPSLMTIEADSSHSQVAAPGFPRDCCLHVFATQYLSETDRSGTYGLFARYVSPPFFRSIYQSVTRPSENLMNANRSSSQVNNNFIMT